jgi:hypothetical protein
MWPLSEWRAAWVKTTNNMKVWIENSKFGFMLIGAAVKTPPPLDFACAFDTEKKHAERTPQRESVFQKNGQWDWSWSPRWLLLKSQQRL